MSNMLDITCQQCGKHFRDYPSNHRKFCCRDCQYLSYKGKEGYWSGKKRWEGKIPPGYKGGPKKCVDCSKPIVSRSKKVKRCRKCSSIAMSGENHWNWKNGSATRRERSSHRYSVWRKEVFVRDNYTCQDCGVRGGKLEAHHIKSFREHPNLRFVVSNGVTFCVACHAKNDKFRYFHLNV
jgi:hypothetical protein